MTNETNTVTADNVDDAPRAILYGKTRKGEHVFYTGRAGEQFVSPTVAESFAFGSRNSAELKRAILNRYTALHGIHFSVEAEA